MDDMRTSGSGPSLSESPAGIADTARLHSTEELAGLPNNVADRSSAYGNLAAANALQSGDNTERVWKEYGTDLRRFILKRVQNEDDAEDILQEVFLKIHLNIDKLKKKDRLQAWIYQIARNTIIDYYRSRKPVIELSQVPEIPEPLGDEPVTASDRVSELGSELGFCLRSMVSDLPEKYREAITLNGFDGLTQKEIADEFGLSLPGAKSRVQRARKRLKEMILGCCHFEFDHLGNMMDSQPKESFYRYCVKEAEER